jgi:hypothetical protein
MNIWNRLLDRMERMNLLDKTVFRFDVDVEPFKKVPESRLYPVHPPHPPHPVQRIRDTEPFVPPALASWQVSV